MSSDSDLDHKDKSNMFPSIWSELHQSPGSRDVLLRLSQFYKSFSQHSKCPDHKAFANHAFIHFRHDCSLKEVFLGTLYAVQGSASCLETTPAVHGLLLGARKLKELHQRPGSPASLIELEAHEKEKLDDLVNSLFEFSIVDLDNKDLPEDIRNISSQLQPISTESESIFKCAGQITANVISTKTLTSSDLKTYLKCVSHQYEIFPELKFFTLDSSSMQERLRYLCEHRQYSAVRRLALLFPETFNVQSSQQLADMMLCGMDKPAADASIPQSYLSIEDFAGFLTSFDKKIPITNKGAYYAKYFVMSGTDGSTPLAPTVNTGECQQLLTDDDNTIKVYLRNVANHMVHLNIHSDDKAALSAMIDLCKHFNLSYDLISQLVHKLRTMRIETLVKTRKWQIAQQMASTPPLKMCLYVAMVAEGLFLQANEVFHLYHLQGQVAPVTVAQMQKQTQEEQEMYLLLPSQICSHIVLVNDIPTLQYAANNLIPSSLLHLSSSNKEENRKPFFVGVDAEWRAVVTRKKTSPSIGASILQISTATKVFIFDMNTLGGRHRGDNPELIAQTENVLHEIFSRHDIVKVGWGFNRNDISMLRASAAGRFASAFRTNSSILDLPRMHAAHVKEKNLLLSHEAQVKASGSASDCCKYYFGKPLSKQEQVSNWDARPLSTSQIQYASLDAHCMLAILDRIATDMNYPECWTGAAEDYAMAERGQGGGGGGERLPTTGSASTAVQRDVWRTFL